METTLDQLVAACLDAPPYGLKAAEKARLLGPALAALTAHHRNGCPAYGAMLDAMGAPRDGAAAFLPVRLFKEMELASVPQEQIVRHLASSGTTGQRPSRVALDTVTAQLQGRALVRILREWLGPARRPLLVIDAPAVAGGAGDAARNARAAGVLGVSLFASSISYALTPDMQPDLAALEKFAAEVGDGPCLAFGFTFMVHASLLAALAGMGREFHLPGAILLHGGGWKKLQEQAVSPRDFDAQVQAQLGIPKVHNFYGYAEQVGTVFVGCEHGHFHAPSAADVFIRKPGTWENCAKGEIGLVQTCSVIPRSYPGHSLLTEDLGELTGEDDCPCGRMGKTFRLHGRLPRAELRGCSDTFAAGAATPGARVSNSPVGGVSNAAKKEPAMAGPQTRPTSELETRAPTPKWRHRGYIPHFDMPGAVQTITFRTVDSIPSDKFEAWKKELGMWEANPTLRPDESRMAQLRERIERYMDECHGACVLRNPTLAKIVEDAFLHFDGERYRLLAWCVMPNHVHVMIEPLAGHLVGALVHSWKTFTAMEINKYLGQTGPFWQDDYFDRYIRNKNHYEAAKEYIEQNPVAANLVAKAKDWPHGSAGSGLANAAT